MFAAEQAALGALRQLAVCASTYRMSHAVQLPSNLPALVSTTGYDARLASPSEAPLSSLALTRGFVSASKRRLPG